MEKNIKVIVRVRPFNRRELEQNQRTLIRVVDDRTLIFDPDEEVDEFFFQGVKQVYRDITKRVNKKLSMEFDNVFDAEATNVNLFQNGLQPLITSVMDGFNCSVFVYGATGAGKTFTMLGSEDCPGATFLTIKELFQQMDDLSEDRKFDIGISYLEVYNEQIMNLLNKTGPLKLREDSNGVVVGGLTLKKIENAEELYSLLILGNKNRTQHPTDSNAESSRSHAIFQVHIRMTDKKTSQKRTVKLSMIDLAGSERAASTKCMGQRFKEGASINKSLLALGNCINSLADGLKHIPYRDSNLTRILKDSLGGNCQTVMIANVSPSSLTYEDTYNTLKYASRAKNIRTKIQQNIIKSNMPKEFYVRKVNDQHNENEKLKNLVKQLEAKLLAATPQPTPVAAAREPTTIKIVDYESPEISEWCQRIDDIYRTLENAQQNFLRLQSKEKILLARTKLKQEAEKFTNILQVDGTKVEMNIAKLGASIDKYGKEQCRQKDEQNRWRKQYFDTIKQLNTMRNEITATKHSKYLLLYLKTKDYELNEQKSSAKEKHLLTLSAIHSNTMENYNKMLPICFEIIQEDYLLFCARDYVDVTSKKKLDHLVKLIQGQKGVKFNDEINLNETDLEQLSLCLNRDGLNSASKRSKPASFDDECDILEPKRNKIKLFKDLTTATSENLEENDENIFLNPNNLLNGIRALDETHVIGGPPSSDDNHKIFDSTFQIPAPIVTKSNGTSKNVLTERNAIDPSSVVFKKVTDLKRTIHGNKSGANKLLAKENKRLSPGRLRKSPATIINRPVIAQKAFTILKQQRTKSTSSQSDSNDSDSASSRHVRPSPLHLKKKKL